MKSNTPIGNFSDIDIISTYVICRNPNAKISDRRLKIYLGSNGNVALHRKAKLQEIYYKVK